MTDTTPISAIDRPTLRGVGAIAAFVILAEVLASSLVGIILWALFVLTSEMSASLESLKFALAAGNEGVLIWSWIDYVYHFEGLNLGFLAYVVVGYAIGGYLAYRIVRRVF